MSLFPYVLFVHVVSVIGLFAALALEWASVRRLAAATTYEQARDWAALWNVLLPVGAPATLVALASGIYLATMLGEGAWRAGWLQVAVPTLVVVAVAGAVVGPRRKRVQAVLASGGGSLSSGLRRQLRDPLLVASWGVRAALLTGLVFVMTAKPQSGGAFDAIGTFAAAGVLGGLLAGRRRERSPAGG